MAVRTYSQLISDISTYLTQKVTIVKHSTLATNIVDTLFNSGNGSGARPYKVYTALLTQAGTNAPVATVLENTLGGTVVWSYDGVGQYRATLASAFTQNKTWFSFINIITGAEIDIRLTWDTINEITLMTALGGVAGGIGVFTDDIITDASIEIRVYPT